MSKHKVRNIPVIFLNTLIIFGATMAGAMPVAASTADSEQLKLTKRHKRPWRERWAVRQAKRDQPSYVLVDFPTPEYSVKVFGKPFYFGHHPIGTSCWTKLSEAVQQRTSRRREKTERHVRRPISPPGSH